MYLKAKGFKLVDRVDCLASAFVSMILVEDANDGTLG